MNEERDDANDLIALFRDEAATGDDAPAHPNVDALIAGDLAEDQARSLAEQALNDPDLALALRVAAAMDEARREAAADEADAPTTLADRAPRKPRTLAIAAVALAAAAAVFLIARPRPPAPIDDDAVRTGVDKRIRPAPGLERLPKDAVELRWVGGPPGATYDVFVSTRALESVHQALDLSGAQTTVPASALRDIPSGSTLLWRVVAVTPDGRKIHSTAFEVVVE